MQDGRVIIDTSIKPLPACILFMMMNFCVKIDDQKNPFK